MTTKKPKLTREEARAFAVRVKYALNNGAKLWVTVPHTSASNMSYTVRARIIGANGDLWLNYWLAAEIGATLNASDDIRQSGVGTDRAFLVACDIAHALRGHGLAGDRYEYDIRYEWF